MKPVLEHRIDPFFLQRFISWLVNLLLKHFIYCISVAFEISHFFARSTTNSHSAGQLNPSFAASKTVHWIKNSLI